MFSAGLTGYNVTKGLMGALRTRAPRRRLVDELLDIPDLAGCLTRLKGLPFLEGIEVGGEPGDIERALLAACAEFGRKVRGCLGGSAGRFIETYMQRHHLHNAKLLFKAVLEGSPEDTLDHLYPVSRRYERAGLAGLRQPRDVIGFFEETKLGDCVREAWEVYSANGDDISLFELVLDRSYINMLWQAGGDVKFGDGRRLRREILLPWLGSTAVLWVMWLGRYRGMGVEEITSLLALPEKVLDARLIHELVATRDPAAAAEGLRNDRLKSFLLRADLPKDPVELHKAAKRFTWRLLAPPKNSIRFDVSTLLAALMRWEFIVEDAITVTGSRSVGLARDEIEPLLATRAA